MIGNFGGVDTDVLCQRSEQEIKAYVKEVIAQARATVVSPLAQELDSQLCACRRVSGDDRGGQRSPPKRVGPLKEDRCDEKECKRRT